MSRFSLSIFVHIISIAMVISQYKRVCYYTSWSQYRNGLGKFSLDYYPPGLCTHLIYAFGKVTYLASTGRVIVSNYDINEDDGFRKIPDYEKMNELKQKQPDLKILLAVGGWTHASRGFTEMVATRERRQQFIEYAISYLQFHQFDGLDFDWEYPAQRGSPSGDKAKFTDLCKETKQAFKKHGFLLTAAVGAGQATADISYEISEISKHLDFINLMSYDLHGPWEGTVGHQTDSNENLKPYQLSVWNAVNHYISSGADPGKIILGLASYGRSQMLSKPCDNDLGANTRYSGGKSGRYTGESGFLAFYEICKLNMREHYCTDRSQVNAPYGSVDNYFVGYDDEESIKYKVEKIMKGKNLGGYMFWAIDLDDFNGVCGGRKFPLMNMAKDVALGKNVSPTITCRSVTETSCNNREMSKDKEEKNTVRNSSDHRCRVNPDGPWANLKKFDFDTWCNNNCPNHPEQGVCGNSGSKDKCICDEISTESSTTISTTITNSLPTTTTTTTTTTSTTTATSTTTTTITTTTTTIEPTPKKPTTTTSVTTVFKSVSKQPTATIKNTSTSPNIVASNTDNDNFEERNTISREDTNNNDISNECEVKKTYTELDLLKVLQKYCSDNCQNSPCFTLSLYCELPSRCL